MSKLSDSTLPHDEMTWTDGSNYGLDGFQFTQTLNEGVMNQGRLPEVNGLSSLPEGFFSSSEADDTALSEDIINEVVGRSKTAEIVDLQWLDPTKPQDLKRLPQEDSITKPSRLTQELEEAWGINRRTTGLELLPNKDKEVADYQKSLESDPPATPGTRSEQRFFKEAVLKAARQVHYREDFESICTELIRKIGKDSAKPVIRKLASDYGLAGNVFVRAEVFPGLKNGKWVSALKQIARTARYVIASDMTLGHKLNMKVVSSVPWKEALEHYASLMKVKGVKLAAEGKPKEIIRQAFLTKEACTVSEQPYAKDVRPSDLISLERAQEIFRTSKPEVVQLTNTQTLKQKQKRQLFFDQLEKWVISGHIPSDQLLQYRLSNKPLSEIMADIMPLIRSTPTSSYEGDGTKLKEYRLENELWSEDDQKHLDAHLHKQFISDVKDKVRQGLLLQEECQILLSLNKPVCELKQLLNALLQVAKRYRESDIMPSPASGEYSGYQGDIYSGQGLKFSNQKDADQALVGHLMKGLLKLAKNGSLTQGQIQRLASLDLPVGKIRQLAASLAEQKKEAVFVPQEIKEYEGTKYRSAAPTTPIIEMNPFQKRILKAAKESKISANEFHNLIRWVRLQLADGVLGDTLDSLLRVRWSQALLDAAQEILSELRKEHEGLSGVLYIDAQAYDQPVGIKGCEDGALKHRTNPIKYVLSIPKCNSCVHNKQVFSGDSVCSIYNKSLVSGFPEEELKAYQKKVIRLANAPDHEVTASYYDSAEYGLQSPLDEAFDLDSATTNEQLGEVLFGGIEL